MNDEWRKTAPRLFFLEEDNLYYCVFSIGFVFFLIFNA